MLTLSIRLAINSSLSEVSGVDGVSSFMVRTLLTGATFVLSGHSGTRCPSWRHLKHLPSFMSWTRSVSVRRAKKGRGFVPGVAVFLSTSIGTFSTPGVVEAVEVRGMYAGFLGSDLVPRMLLHSRQYLSILIVLFSHPTKSVGTLSVAKMPRMSGLFICVTMMRRIILKSLTALSPALRTKPLTRTQYSSAVIFPW